MNHDALMRDDPDWATTRALIASDFNRFVSTMGPPAGLLKKVFWFLMPNYLCLFFYRLYRWLYVSDWRNAARVLQLFSLYVTRVEIPPTTIIGPACLIGHAGGVVLYGRIGARFTAFGDAGTGGGVGDGDIGGGPDLPVLGDDVVMAYRSGVLGPVRIGNGARIGPGCIVTKDVPDGATVIEAPPRILRQVAPQAATPATTDGSEATATAGAVDDKDSDNANNNNNNREGPSMTQPDTTPTTPAAPPAAASDSSTATAAAASPGPVPTPALSWADTRALIASDMARLVTHLRADSLSHRMYYALLPGFQALLWHRISRYFYLRNWRNASRLISLFAMYLTRAEIPPTSSLGPSALIAHATGVYIFGRVGARLTVHGHGGFGGGFGEEDIGAGPGYALVGDDVVVAFGARAFGAIRIGNGAKFGPGAQTTKDVPAGALVLWPQSRIIEGGAGAPLGTQP